MSKSSKSEDPHDPTYAQLGDLLYAMPPNAYKVRPFVDFTDWVKWAELNGIKFNVTAYKNHTQCTEFVNFISKTLFEEDVKRKLKNANFIVVFYDGSTDSAVI